MDISLLLSGGVVVIVLTLAYMAWSMYRTGERPQSLGELALQVEAAEKWALLAVKAAQQLFTSEQISKSERFYHADKFLLETLPNLDPNQRQMLIESAVYVLHQARAVGILPHGGDEQLEERVEELEDIHGR